MTSVRRPTFSTRSGLRLHLRLIHDHFLDRDQAVVKIAVENVEHESLNPLLPGDGFRRRGGEFDEEVDLLSRYSHSCSARGSGPLDWQEIW